MSYLTKTQKIQLANSLEGTGLTTSDFKRSEDNKSITFYFRDSTDRFMIRSGSIGGYYQVDLVAPGTERVASEAMDWGSVIRSFNNWAQEVKLENEAVDPWEQAAEDMANDDGLFTVAELPKVDEAIDASLAMLQEKALKQGIPQNRIEAELGEIKSLLIKTARTSTKKEWMTIFTGAIVGKLVEWGMDTALFQGVLHTLINAAQDVTQLAEHASKFIP